MIQTPINFIDSVRAYYVGTFFNNFIPTSVGGDLVKVFQLNKTSTTTTSGCSMTVFLERVSGIGTLVTFAGIFAWLRPSWYAQVGLGFLQYGQLWILASLIMAAVVLAINLVSRKGKEPQGNNLLSQVLRWFDFPLNYPLTTLSLLTLSVIFHGLRALSFVLIAKGLGSDLSILVAIFVLPVIAFATFLPISLGGIGLREGIITFCLKSFGLSLGVSLSLSLLVRAFSITHSLIGGLIYLFEPPIRTESATAE